MKTKVVAAALLFICGAIVLSAPVLAAGKAEPGKTKQVQCLSANRSVESVTQGGVGSSTLSTGAVIVRMIELELTRRLGLFLSGIGRVVARPDLPVTSGHSPEDPIIIPAKDNGGVEISK